MKSEFALWSLCSEFGKLTLIMNPILAHSLPLAFRNQSTTKTMNG